MKVYLMTGKRVTFTQRGKERDTGFVRVKGKTVSGFVTKNWSQAWLHHLPADTDIFIGWCWSKHIRLTDTRAGL